ncbi:hypothetical protein B0H16DRAFT_1425608 [Mycena metata]|uniref:Uncharacterized protein n=1 Tax=Mycena metata TaxID=1033252 RepID=A0AAD7I785_9AGAR|nr:hypothetical protein B0H16DRAFT_1425608 [Mycena metata]
MLYTLLLSRAPSLNSTFAQRTDSCDDINNCRKLFDIVWGCLATIFASTWVSVHPNVPAPHQGPLKATLRRLGMMLVAVIAPELIVFFAARQLVVARQFAQRYSVSTTHGFFFCMGGFVSRQGGPVTTIDQFKDPVLGPEYRADIRNTRREDIMDKSKGDGLSKGLALMQGLWFIVQIIARLAQRLPISELEVATLAFALVNIFTWILWWHKPLDVQEPILIAPADTRSYLLPVVKISNLCGASDFTPLLDSFAHDAEAAPAFPVSTEAPVPRPTVHHTSKRRPLSETIFRGPIQGTYTHYQPRLSRAVPQFWSSPDEPGHTAFAAMFVAIVFGAVHCAAWGAAFPSTPERVLWRVSAVAIAAYPATLLIPHGLGALLWPTKDVHDHVPLAVQIIGIVLYAFSRVVLIVLAFTTVRRLEAGWFVDVDWTVYIPHL